MRRVVARIGTRVRDTPLRFGVKEWPIVRKHASLMRWGTSMTTRRGFHEAIGPRLFLMPDTAGEKGRPLPPSRTSVAPMRASFRAMPASLARSGRGFLLKQRATSGIRGSFTSMRPSFSLMRRSVELMRPRVKVTRSRVSVMGSCVNVKDLSVSPTLSSKSSMRRRVNVVGVRMDEMGMRVSEMGLRVASKDVCVKDFDASMSAMRVRIAMMRDGSPTSGSPRRRACH
jgi:hypothetical protein